MTMLAFAYTIDKIIIKLWKSTQNTCRYLIRNLNNLCTSRNNRTTSRNRSSYWTSSTSYRITTSRTSWHKVGTIKAVLICAIRINSSINIANALNAICLSNTIFTKFQNCTAARASIIIDISNCIVRNASKTFIAVASYAVGKCKITKGAFSISTIIYSKWIKSSGWYINESSFNF